MASYSGKYSISWIFSPWIFSAMAHNSLGYISWALPVEFHLPHSSLLECMMSWPHHTPCGQKAQYWCQVHLVLVLCLQLNLRGTIPRKFLKWLNQFANLSFCVSPLVWSFKVDFLFTLWCHLSTAKTKHTKSLQLLISCWYPPLWLSWVFSFVICRVL